MAIKRGVERTAKNRILIEKHRAGIKTFPIFGLKQVRRRGDRAQPQFADKCCILDT